MTGRVPDSVIQEILNRIDILELIHSRVPLKKMGANHMACCPFHQEKTPSFSVNADKQFYHCFGCGKHGDALQFLIEFENLSFMESLSELAKQAGVTLPQQNQKEEFSALAPLYEATEKATSFFCKALIQSEEAIQYLKNRGLEGKTAKRFRMGYAPPEWKKMLEQLGTTSEVIQAFSSAGLLVKSAKNQYYDRFRDRIMFPIRDKKGRVLGFGGRVLEADQQPKYLNSPETPLFKKGQILYGLYEALQENSKLSSLLVVEGYMDVVMLSQSGFTEVVATLGTAVTTGHLENLFRVVKKILFCFDGDEAGRRAAWRTLEVSLPFMTEGHMIQFVFLPKNCDPDSFVRKEGKEAFQNLLNRAYSLGDYLLSHLCEGLDVTHMEGRMQIVALARPLLERLPRGVFRELLFHRLSQLVGLESSSLQEESGQPTFQPSRSTYRKKFNRQPTLPHSPAIRATALLLNHRYLLGNTGSSNDYKYSNLPDSDLFAEVVEILLENPMIETEALLRKLPALKARHFIESELAVIAQFVPESGVVAEFLGSLERMREGSRNKTLDDLLTKSRYDKLSDSEKKLLKELLAAKTVVD